jgi:hypothetical protein
MGNDDAAVDSPSSEEGTRHSGAEGPACRADPDYVENPGSAGCGLLLGMGTTSPESLPRPKARRAPLPLE